jgi:hypothetical protein
MEVAAHGAFGAAKLGRELVEPAALVAVCISADAAPLVLS